MINPQKFLTSELKQGLLVFSRWPLTHGSNTKTSSPPSLWRRQAYITLWIFYQREAWLEVLAQYTLCVSQPWTSQVRLLSQCLEAMGMWGTNSGSTLGKQNVCVYLDHPASETFHLYFWMGLYFPWQNWCMIWGVSWITVPASGTGGSSLILKISTGMPSCLVLLFELICKFPDLISRRRQI